MNTATTTIIITINWSCLLRQFIGKTVPASLHVIPDRLYDVEIRPLRGTGHLSQDFLMLNKVLHDSSSMFGVMLQKGFGIRRLPDDTVWWKRI